MAIRCIPRIEDDSNRQRYSPYGIILAHRQVWWHLSRSRTLQWRISASSFRATAADVMLALFHIVYGPTCPNHTPHPNTKQVGWRKLIRILTWKRRRNPTRGHYCKGGPPTYLGGHWEYAAQLGNLLHSHPRAVNRPAVSTLAASGWRRT